MKIQNKTNPRKVDQNSRILTIGEIEDDTVNDVIADIYDINEFDGSKSIEKREPIKLIINSCGGSVYSGLALLDVIELSETPIYTICHGRAMSMALPILCGGHHRIISSRATLMYHEISWDDESVTLTKSKNDLIENERLQRIIDSYIVSKTVITLKQLSSVRKQAKDWYITPEQAIELKIVDKII